MRALWLIIQREFVSNVLTSRFMIGFIVCLLSTAVAVFVQVDDYEKRLAGYNTAAREAEAEAREWDIYSKIKPRAHRKPNPLGIFNVGAENFGANTVTVELAKPIFKFTIPIWGAPTQKRGSDNPFLAMFLTVDVIFIFQILLSILTILFAYNSISGEREDGTLKLVLSNAIPKDTLVLGKYLGGMLSLVPIVVVSLIVALLLALFSPATAFDIKDMAHIVLIFAVSLLYVSTWYLLGFLLSVWTKEAATTLILSMFIWVILTVVHSNVVPFAVEKFPPQIPKPEREFVQQASDIWNQFKKERGAYLKQRGYDEVPDTVSWIHGAEPGVVFSRSTFGWFFEESYNVTNISQADVSIFQEILGYQEPLRIRYADKVQEILSRPWELQEANTQFADNIARISFADVYAFAVGAIAGTDRKSYNDFLSATRTYKREIVTYLTDKKAFSSREWFSSDQGKAELANLPVFHHRRLSLSESLSRASIDIFILLAWNVILFMAAYVSFLRYDMS